MAKKIVDLETELTKALKSILMPFGWDAITIGMSLHFFHKNHGADKLEAMSRFLKWSKKNDKTNSWIASAVGHDLNGCEDTMMSPRTGGY